MQDDSEKTQNVSTAGDNSNQVEADDDAITQIKKRTLKELLPVLDNLNVAPERKFEILLSATRFSFDDKLLNKALESALTIDNPSVKADALIDILGEIDFHQSNSSNS